MSSADREQTPAAPAGGRGAPGVSSFFAVDEFTGAASLRLPLPTSAPRGLSPDLELLYQSTGGNGPAGLGFSLPIPSIALYTGAGVPRYDGGDSFAIGPQALVPLPGAPRRLSLGGVDYTVTRYARRSAATVERIERWTRDADGDTVWRQIDPGGLESVYGLDAGARIADPADPRRVFEWLLQAQYDRRGEAISYEYLAEDAANLPGEPSEAGRDHSAQRYPSRVRYAPQTPVTPPEYGIGPVPEVEWHAEVVFDYGQYDADPANPSPCRPCREWPARPDPFSRYWAGFEVRTHRLLAGVMLFHRFAELGPEPALVHLIRLSYDRDPVASRLTRYDSIGCADGEFAPLPPLELGYAPLEIGTLPFAAVESAGGEQMVGVADPPFYGLADLSGAGVGDVLYADGQSVLRRPAASGEGVAYGDVEAVPEFPVQRSASGSSQLRDMTGEGRADLLVSSLGRAGIYPHGDDDSRPFGPFGPFGGAPTELGSPVATLADLSNDGLPDLVTLLDGRLRRYPGEGAAGFGAAAEVPTPEGAPAGLDGGRQALVAFADLLGGGAEDLVRIADGSVECWPSLGYGTFGQRVRLGGAPCFGEEFDPLRVRLADLTGSGLADILYVEADRVLVYANRSGNSFAPPVEVRLPTTIGSPSQVEVADLRGSGRPMLVIGAQTPRARHWACPVAGEDKPFLLTTLRNGLGAETRLRYSTSTRYRLEDAAAGIAWATTLPFPVPVVAEVVQRDAVSASSEAKAYRYRHGLWCPQDHEYGFALVERRDLESTGAEGDSARRTRTWRLLGTLPDPGLEAAIRSEWFAGDPHRPELPGPAVSWQGAAPADAEKLRQAYASLRGRSQREEIYAAGDGVDATPYRVTQSAHEAAAVAVPEPAPFAAFLTHEGESLVHLYEREVSDPAVHHSLNLEVDGYGQVLRSLTVAYPRRPGAADMLPEQEATLILCNAFAYVDLDTAADFHVGIPSELRRFQLTGLPAPPVAGCFSFAELRALAAEALAGKGGMAAETLERSAYLYYAADGVTPAPQGESGPQVLPLTERHAAFTDAEVRTLFAGVLKGTALNGVLEESEYSYDPASEIWWTVGATETYLPAAGFYRTASAIDPCGATELYAYDATTVALMRTEQQAEGILVTDVSVESFDYNALLPLVVRDVNESITEVTLDPLAQVVLSSRRGTELGRPVGFETPTGRHRPGPPSAAALIAEPATYLRGAAAVFSYDLLCWAGQVTATRLAPLGLDPAALLAALAAAGYVTPEGVLLQAFRDLSGAAAMRLPEPFAAHAAAIYAVLAAVPCGQPARWASATARDYPGRDPGPPALAVDHVDGFGRVVQHKQQVSPRAEEGWATSGGVRYNCRGLVRARYQSFFSNGWEFSPEALAGGAVPPTITTYDPLDRPIRTDRPPGFFSGTEIAAWTLTEADEVDTVLQSRYWKEHSGGQGIGPHELQALRQAAVLAETPAVSYLDPLGRTIARIDLLKGATGQRQGETAPLVTRYGRDALGRLTWSADPRLSASGAAKSFENTYGFIGNPLRVIGADAGEQLRLTSAGGQERLLRDGRGIVIETDYDSLARPTTVTVRAPGAAARIAEAYFYGDQLLGGGPIVPDPAGWNLVGEVYRLFDPAGMRQLDGYSLTGRPMAVSQQYLADPEAEPSWTPEQALPTSPLLSGEAWESARSYDAGGRMTAMTDPAGNAYVWTYDQVGFTAAISLALAGQAPVTYLSGVEYNAAGQRTRARFGNGTVADYGYDPFTLRLLSAVTTKGESGPALQQLSYVYDPVGNVTYAEDPAFNGLFGNSVPPLEHSYAYDSLYRLATATGPEPAAYTPDLEREPGYQGLAVATLGGALPAGSLVAATRTHAYDEAGNLYWTERVGGGSAWTTETIHSVASNRGVSAALLGLTPTPSGPVPPPRTLPAAQIDRFFDGDGNQVVVEQMPAVGWDYADQIARATTRLPTGEGRLLRAHDGVNRLMRELRGAPTGDGEETVDTLHLGTLQVARTSAPGEQPTTEQRVEVSERGDQIAELRVRDGTVAVAYSLSDPAGSVALRLGPQGELLSYEAYAPYGATVFAILLDPAEAESKLRRYDGQERDRGSGTYRFERRDLAPWLGRWLSPDPSGALDGLNLYSFTGGNPTSYTDLDGRVKLRIGSKTITVTAEQILEAVWNAAKAIQAAAAKAAASPIGKRKAGRDVILDLYEAKEKGDLLRLAFNPDLRGDETGDPQLEKTSFALRFGAQELNMTGAIKEPGVHATRVPGEKTPAYADLVAKAPKDKGKKAQAEAKRLIHLFKVKTTPKAGDPSAHIAPVMAISETDRSITGGLLAMIELYNVKYGQHSFSEAFTNGNNPFFIGARADGGARALKHIDRDYRETMRPGQEMDADQLPKLHASLETFVKSLHELRRTKTGGVKTSKFAGATCAAAVLDTIKETLIRRSHVSAQDQAAPAPTSPQHSYDLRSRPAKRPREDDNPKPKPSPDVRTRTSPPTKRRRVRSSNDD